MSAVMNAVYGHYLTTDPPRQTARHAGHKKGELRSVYASIVKLNKESFWYLPTTSRSALDYAVDLKEHARELHNTIASLGGLEESGLLNKKTAYSSRPEIASATFIGTCDESPTYRLEVRELASPQENLGNFLPNAKVNLAPDTYSFDIAINDMNYEFQFPLGEAETNLDVQKRLQRLIGSADIGLTASLVESGGKTALKLTTQATGLPAEKAALFSITDDRTSKTAGAVGYFGLNDVSRQAANAHFFLNGEPRESSANHFTIGRRFDVRLYGVSPEGTEVTLGLKTDVESFTDNVVNLIDGYNSFIQAAASYLETQPRSRQLLREMSGIAALNYESLESMGLRLQEDGRLQVDPEALTQAVSDAKDQNAPFDFLRGFTHQLLRQTNQISLNPMAYVERKIVAYKIPGRSFANPYVTSAYSGMIFSSYG
ncbi:MAG: hypothetical protein LBQ15_03035 [Clostridium sp.]|jgi:flagellar hook-associated protein 2|nr:hypothetical protein [Clostridium sp.]